MLFLWVHVYVRQMLLHKKVAQKLDLNVCWQYCFFFIISNNIDMSGNTIQHERRTCVFFSHMPEKSTSPTWLPCLWLYHSSHLLYKFPQELSTPVLYSWPLLLASDFPSPEHRVSGIISGHKQSKLNWLFTLLIDALFSNTGNFSQQGEVT